MILGLPFFVRIKSQIVIDVMKAKHCFITLKCWHFWPAKSSTVESRIQQTTL